MQIKKTFLAASLSLNFIMGVLIYLLWTNAVLFRAVYYTEYDPQIVIEQIERGVIFSGVSAKNIKFPKALAVIRDENSNVKLMLFGDMSKQIVGLHFQGDNIDSAFRWWLIEGKEEIFFPK